MPTLARASTPFLARTTTRSTVSMRARVSEQRGAALASLRRVDREILLLHAWAEFSDTEVAVALSLPVGTVKSRLHRTRETLRNRLAAGGQSAANTSIKTVEERR